MGSGILIFKTDLKTKSKVGVIEPLLNTHSSIAHWSVDTEKFVQCFKGPMISVLPVISCMTIVVICQAN